MDKTRFQLLENAACSKFPERNTLTKKAGNFPRGYENRESKHGQLLAELSIVIIPKIQVPSSSAAWFESSLFVYGIRDLTDVCVSMTADL